MWVFVVGLGLGAVGVCYRDTKAGQFAIAAAAATVITTAIVPVIEGRMRQDY